MFPAMVTSGELRRRYPDAFVVRPWIYWIDFLGSAGVGWGAFAMAGRTPFPSLAGLLWFAVAVLALYRAVLFIHEIAHLRKGALRAFEPLWNLAVGFPMGAPSIMYVGPHMEHHRSTIYGTNDDPEYAAFARWSRAVLFVKSFTMLAVPGLLVIRWAILGPFAWIFPPLRRWTVEQASTLMVNPGWKRRWPRDRRRWLLCEAGTAIVFWSAIAAAGFGVISWHWLALWYALGAAVLVLNHLRTLGAHRYVNEGERMNNVEQLVDSVNVAHPSAALLAPVGLRFHALHHMAPAIPYHSLGGVHRRLMAELPADDPYRSANATSLLGAVVMLFRRDASGDPVWTDAANAALRDASS